MNKNLVNLECLLQSHDWNFNYSDDHSIWKRGVTERDNINQEQKRLIHSELATIEEIVELTGKYRPENT